MKQINIITKKKIKFAGKTIILESAQSGKHINIYNRLKHPEDFHGSPLVDHVVRFKDSFVSLIGKYNSRKFGPWNQNSLHKNRIYILEHHYDEARIVMEKINTLAKRAVEDKNLYDDKSFCLEYFMLAKVGYQLLRKHRYEFGLEIDSLNSVSLVRAGLVATRLAKGLGRNAVVPNETQIVTKRTHLINDNDRSLTVTVKWENKFMLQKIHNQHVALADFVNPASGASTAAFIIAAKHEGIDIQGIVHLSICATRQGIMFNKLALEKMNVSPIFYSVGLGDVMNDQYYLISNRTVGDAGHMLRWFLPDHYQDIKES